MKWALKWLPVAFFGLALPSVSMAQTSAVAEPPAAFIIPIFAQDAQPAPLSYDCYRTKTPIRIDGKLDDAAWKKAKWTSDFVDIEGAAKPTPRFRTRAKMLWDDTVSLHRGRA